MGTLRTAWRYAFCARPRSPPRRPFDPTTAHHIDRITAHHIDRITAHHIDRTVFHDSHTDGIDSDTVLTVGSVSMFE